MNTILRTAHILRNEWLRNYRYHGGINAMLRGLMTLTQLKAGFYRNLSPVSVDWITFSVVPEMTTIWEKFVLENVNVPHKRIIIGDCSGGLRELRGRHPETLVIPVFNTVHGEKLDLFMKTVCNGEYVVVSDDDVMWLNTVPYRWAIDAMRNSPQTAVVSLFPRQVTKAIFPSSIPQAMGSYCLVIRRDVWIRENLSFQIVRPSDLSEKDPRIWYYDTSDFAHVELVARGYEVVIAPPEIRSHIIEMEGVSFWIVKIQRLSGEIAPLLHNSFHVEKAFRAILFAQCLFEFHNGSSVRKFRIQDSNLRNLLNISKEYCLQKLSTTKRAQIESEMEINIERIRETQFGRLASRTHTLLQI